MKNKISKKILAGLMSVTLAAGILSTGTVMKEKQVKNLPVALAADGTATETATSTVTPGAFYVDFAFTKNATAGSIVAYANGYKEYRTASVYTKIRPTYIFTSKTDKNGKTTVRSTTSKLLVTTSISETDSPFTEDGTKVDTKDEGVKTAKNMATASVRNGIVTVTGQKEAGTVYVWMKDSNPAEETTYCIPATIKMAPKKLELYAETMNDNAVMGAKNITAGYINIDSSQDVYLYAYNIGNNKEKKGVYKEITINATLDKKSAEYFTVNKIDQYYFTITATNLAKDSKVENKFNQFTGKVTFTCDQSGAKTSFSVTAGNHVKEFGWTVPDASKDKVKCETWKDWKENVQLSVTSSAVIANPDNVKCTGSDIQLAVGSVTSSAVIANLDLKVNSFMKGEIGLADKAFVKEISKEMVEKIESNSKFETDKNGLPKENVKEKSGITASLGKNKQTNSDSLILKAKKGIEVGKTGYFMVVFSGGASSIIQVTTVKTLGSE